MSFIFITKLICVEEQNSNVSNSNEKVEMKEHKLSNLLYMSIICLR